MKRINIALIGCGNFTREIHLPNLRADARYHIHAAMDVKASAAEAICELVGTGYWTTEIGRIWEDPQVEAVLIATPHFNHAEIAVQAALAGKHIFCEKPMGLSETECLSVVEAVRQSGVKYTTNYNRCAAPFTLQAGELLASLGAPRLIYHRWANWNPYSTGWLRDEKLSGGRFIGEAGHALDMICRLADQVPQRVYAEGGDLLVDGTPDSAVITLGFPDGSAGVLYLSSIANNNFPKEEITVTCANHTVVIYDFQRMDIFSSLGRQTFELPEMDRGQVGMLGAFAQAILDDTSPMVDLENALQISRISFAVLEAIRDHKVKILTGVT
jgi:predicted dehydrogenase